MKKTAYINGIGAVTAQGVWSERLLEDATELQQAIAPVQHPSYKEMISPAMVRRMSNGIKMGIYASQQALDEAEIAMPDAIVAGTGLGCLEDSEKFLRNVLDNDEQFLTPTAFIQSTHNTVASQIALRLQCKAYNFTYVHRSVSFESALLDALLQLQSGEATHILAGASDEISDHTYSLLQQIGYIKQDGIQESVKNSTSVGVNYSEGAVFFGLSTNKMAHTYAEIVDVRIQNDVNQGQLKDFVALFLQENNVAIEEVDALILGINGDIESDPYYTRLLADFDAVPTVYYKHLIGQFDSSSAFGLAVASQLLKHQALPKQLFWQEQERKNFRYVLLYNQFKGKDHSLVLLRAC